jgi:hypothetical protein
MQPFHMPFPGISANVPLSLGCKVIMIESKNSIWITKLHITASRYQLKYRYSHCKDWSNVMYVALLKRSLKLGHVSTSTRPSATALPGS